MQTQKTVNLVRNTTKAANQVLKNQYNFLQGRTYTTLQQGLRCAQLGSVFNKIKMQHQQFSSIGLFNPRMSTRSFASYPSHLKLEMPNLSPTMEKVSFINPLTFY